MDRPDTPPTSRERPRTLPAERFAPPELVVDTRTVVTTLRHEAAGPTGQGHRQMTVLRRGPVRMVVFALDAGGGLPEHAVDGLVTIHVLAGALTVRTPNAQHELSAGMLLVLDPQIPHGVTATEPTEMLLTVHLAAERPAAA